MKENPHDVFQQKVRLYVQAHLKNPNFGLEHLMAEFKLGRTRFFLRFRKVFGVTPGDYIRIARLQKAALLLRMNQLSVAQIAIEVGFTNGAYFTKCFRQQYGITPTEYQKKKPQ